MLTTLEIINQMLASTGTAPLTSNDAQHPLYIKANNKLKSVSLVIQSRGWWFNRAVRTLKQDVNGEVVLPANALHADPVDRTLNYTTRGNKLYNPQEGSYVINADVEVYYVDRVEVDDLPPQAQEYLRARAVYEFYLDEDGTGPKLREYLNARNEAWVMFKAEHLKNADVNWFDSTSYAQMQRGNRGNRLPPYSTR